MANDDSIPPGILAARFRGRAKVYLDAVQVLIERDPASLIA